MNRPLEALVGLAGVVAISCVGIANGAEEHEGTGEQPPRYRIVRLADPGGDQNSANSINNDGVLAGYTNLPDNTARRAALWTYGFRADLGTLGGPNSNVPWPSKNTIGLIAGIAQTDVPEPLNQTWSCRSFFAAATRSGFTCQAVVWEQGRIRALPTLGGYNGFATGANNHRQIVGWAQNRVEDPTCNRAHVTQQFRAVMWGPGADDIRELPPLPGDSTSAATAINDQGQVVGISGNCGTAVGSSSARRAVIWENGKPRDIGSLGGIAWNTPMAINERGEVVGFSNVSAQDGNAFNARAFYWKRGRGIESMGVLKDTQVSQALGINKHGVAVGTSCTSDFSVCRAFVWRQGRMSDLNELRASASPTEVLYAANDINDDGHIALQVFDSATNRLGAAWAIPLQNAARSDDADDGGSAAANAAAPLPAEARERHLQRFGITNAGVAL